MVDEEEGERGKPLSLMEQHQRKLAAQTQKERHVDMDRMEQEKADRLKRVSDGHISTSQHSVRMSIRSSKHQQHIAITVMLIYSTNTTSWGGGGGGGGGVACYYAILLAFLQQGQLPCTMVIPLSPVLLS